MQYDGRPDGRVGEWVGTWKLGSLLLWMKGRRYKLWCSGKGDGVGSVGVVVKEELCEKVVELRRASERVTTVVVLEEDVLR